MAIGGEGTLAYWVDSPRFLGELDQVPAAAANASLLSAAPDPRCLIGLGGPDLEIAVVGPQHV
jgi:hypothetical protein